MSNLIKFDLDFCHLKHQCKQDIEIDGNNINPEIITNCEKL